MNFFRKFHTHILQFDGQGYWEFSELNFKSRLDLKKEKEELLKQPNSTNKTERLAEINKQLGEDDNWIFGLSVFIKDIIT